MITENMEIVWFESKHLLLFKSKKVGEEQKYNGEVFVRRGNSIEKR